MASTRSLLVGAAFGAGALVGRASASQQLRFARMTGSSIAAPDAAGWITDFLNAAYYRREPDRRDVDDLRLAWAIVTTRWHRLGHRRLRLGDAIPFHSAFGRDRFVDGARSARGTLDRGQLLDGAARLLGDWFTDAYGDDERRGWGIAFETPGERAAHDPEVRLRLARLGISTPPEAPGREQTWHTYPSVEVPSSDGVIAALSRPETWPDYASSLGRFTPLRRGGLAGQTFEIEVVAGAAGGRPILTRGYVTITTLVSREDPEALRRYIDELNDGLARFGRDEPPAVAGGRRAGARVRPDDARGALHGSEQEPARALRGAGPRVRARGRDVGSDAVAHRPGLPARRARRPARVLGPGLGCRGEHAGPDRRAARPGARVTDDAIVIGSGPNGLAAAITLAEAGRRSRCWSAPRRGGAVATAELTLPGFRHDTFSSVYPAAAASPVFARWPLERHGLRWVHPRYCYAHPLPDGRAAILARDVNETAASLDALSPGDGDAWRRFVSPYIEHFDAWRATMLSGFPPLAGPLKLIAAARLNGILDWARLLLMPAEALGRELFRADGARAWLYGAAVHGDVLPGAAGSAIAAAHLNIMGHAVGWPSPHGGAAGLTDALAGHLRELGGRTRANAPVARIAAERGRVVGVELEDGERRRPRWSSPTSRRTGCSR